MIALGVMTVGVLGVAGVITAGMKTIGTTPADVISAQKASQTIEAVYSARDARTLTWAQIKNSADGGVFRSGAQSLYQPGPDGLVHTTDDLSAIESVVLPGPDQLIGTTDDKIETLTGYTRELVIADVAGSSGNLRTLTVTISYPSGSTRKTFTLSTLISRYF